MLLFGHIHVICHVFSNEGISKRGLHREMQKVQSPLQEAFQPNSLSEQ